MKAIFVRHGKDDDGYRGGWSDLDLIPEGVEQAKQLAKHLENTYRISKIISSDLPRALTTARHISDLVEIEIEKQPQLREMDNGDLAGMLNETALIQYLGLFFNTLKMDEAYPNGESPRAFYTRIRNWFDRFKCQNTDDTVLVVTHGGVINIVYHLVKGIDWSNQGPSFKISNCGVHVLDMDTMKFEIENKTDYIG